MKLLVTSWFLSLIRTLDLLVYYTLTLVEVFLQLQVSVCLSVQVD